MSSEPRTAPRWLAPLLKLRQRQAWVWLHRWVGLVMTLFLVVAGLTGSLIAFYGEIDGLLVPQAHPRVEARDTPMLDAVTLREIARTARPDMHIGDAIAPWKADEALSVYMYRPGTEVEGEMLLDPYTGQILHQRTTETASTIEHVMPFIYRLHYSLALGEIGTLAFGIVALLWTLDCFLGAYLTFPRGRPFLQKWKPAWGIKTKRLNYDLHRASGLWTWAMLFVFAWSSVAFNLNSVYEPVTRAVLGYAEHPQLPAREFDQPEPGLGWRAGYRRGQALMREAAATHGITGYREDALRYDAHRAEFAYWVATKFRGGEAYDWFGVIFDANSGELLRIDGENTGPGNERAGDFVTRWLLDLHMARVWGLPFRIFVCAMGLVVTALSVTGVIIWWRKRRGGNRTARTTPA